MIAKKVTMDMNVLPVDGVDARVTLIVVDITEETCAQAEDANVQVLLNVEAHKMVWFAQLLLVCGRMIVLVLLMPIVKEMFSDLNVTSLRPHLNAVLPLIVIVLQALLEWFKFLVSVVAVLPLIAQVILPPLEPFVTMLELTQPMNALDAQQILIVLELKRFVISVLDNVLLVMLILTAQVELARVTELASLPKDLFNSPLLSCCHSLLL